MNWNIEPIKGIADNLRRTFTGAWIETPLKRVTAWANPSSHLHGCVNWNQNLRIVLNLGESHLHGCVNWNKWHPLRQCNFLRRTFTGAWIETSFSLTKVIADMSHLHGCVNWNTKCECNNSLMKVAPSRVRELKHNQNQKITFFFLSHLHGCVNWNQAQEEKVNDLLVAPSRVRELKPDGFAQAVTLFKSHLHGCVNWNYSRCTVCFLSKVAPSRVRELKPPRKYLERKLAKVAPSRVRELKQVWSQITYKV